MYISLRQGSQSDKLGVLEPSFFVSDDEKKKSNGAQGIEMHSR